MTKEIEKWWEETSQHYQESTKIGIGTAHYGPYAPDENELRLLGNVRGKKILEIGCGGGQCSVAFAKQGAVCTGIDISKEQLKFAENLAKKNKIKVNFTKGDIQTLKGIKSGSFDIVFSAFALQYVPDLTKCFREVFRVLKKKGLFVFSLDHPFYDVINDKTFKIKTSYFETGKMIEGKFVFYKRKVSDILNSLIESKFSVEKMIEPLKLKVQKSWRGGRWDEIYPPKLVKLIGPTIIFKAVKK